MSTKRARQRAGRKAAPREYRLKPITRDWRITALRGDLPDMPCRFEQLVIEDASTLMTGSVRLRLARERMLSLSEGDVLRVDSAPIGTGAFREEWRMRLGAPERDPIARTLSAQLVADMGPLQQGALTWSFVKSRARPKGWTADAATRHIAERIGMPVASLPKCTARFSISKKKASPYEMLVEVWKREREETGRRFVIEIRRGVLVVREVKASGRTMHLAGRLTGATVSRRRRDTFATVLTVKGSTPRGRRRDPVRVTVSSRAARRRFGLIHREVDLEASTVRGARKLGLRSLERRLRPIRSVTVTGPGSPRLRRGDPVQIDLEGEQLPDDLWTRSITHTITAAGHQMQVVARFDDPLDDPAGDRIKKKARERAKSRRERQRS